MLGLVLLLGIVAVSSVGILVVASETTTELQQQSETDRIEGAFVELSQQMAEASTKSDVSKAMDLAAGERGAVVKKDSGWIKIESAELEEPLNLSIGTIEYVGDDGTRIAYQAGGVWRETGNETRTVAAPPIHYSSQSETFTFPVVTVSGAESLGSGDVTISHNRTGTFTNATVVQDDSIEIAIKSEYYRGWQQYFERQTGESSIRSVDHDRQLLTVRLGHLDIEEAFENGIVISEGADIHHNANVEGEVVSGTLPQLDRVIDDMVENFNTSAYDVGTLDGTDGTLTNGTYFTDGLELQASLPVDVGDGNVTVVVDGDVNVNGHQLHVVNADGTDHAMKVYATGDLIVDGGNVCVDPCGGAVDAERLQVYGTSTMQVTIGPGGTIFEGIIYAPSDDGFDTQNEVAPNHCADEQVCIISNVRFDGAVVASSVNVQSSSVSFAHDPNLVNVRPDLEPEGYTLPPQLTYLNVAHHEVNVENV
ncbi:hypothetical protein GCM10025298_25110 [Natronobiforma cellulositropha]|nr:hypothetical protein [Natronobiforma cellulositropha]